MNRRQLEHVLRAAAAIADETSFVVVSQAVPLPFPDAPAALLAIASLSSFDETFGHHADGVGPETAVMPDDRIERASLHYIADVTAICPDLHVFKSVAARNKERIGRLKGQRFVVDTLRAWARRRAAEATAA